MKELKTRLISLIIIAATAILLFVLYGNGYWFPAITNSVITMIAYHPMLYNYIGFLALAGIGFFIIISAIYKNAYYFLTVATLLFFYLSRKMNYMFSETLPFIAVLILIPQIYYYILLIKNKILKKRG